jgi:hypothetical protein
MIGNKNQRFGWYRCLVFILKDKSVNTSSSSVQRSSQKTFLSFISNLLGSMMKIYTYTNYIINAYKYKNSSN